MVPEPRSAQLGKLYNYSLEVNNIGDVTATNWNVTAGIPSYCNVTSIFNNGVWHSDTRKIEWSLPNLAVYGSSYLNFTLNCSTAGKLVINAEGIRNTNQEATYVNDTGIGCATSSCSSTQAFTLTKPSAYRYEGLKEIDFLVFYNWTAAGLTIGEGSVNFSDDNNNPLPAWQEYSF